MHPPLAHLIHAFAGIQLYPKALHPRANIIGGLLGGVGLALSGLCPGPLFSQVGSARPEAFYSLSGALAGTAAFVYAYPHLRPALERGYKNPQSQLHTTLGLRFGTVSAALIGVVLVRVVLFVYYFSPPSLPFSYFL